MSAKCPICEKPVAPKYRPFCSRRCADVDLGRWLKGGYSIPGEPAGEEDMQAAARPDSQRPREADDED
mgnify:CR=1 FL=1